MKKLFFILGCLVIFSVAFVSQLAASDAIYFDGNGDYLTVPYDIQAVFNGSPALSFEVWIYPTYLDRNVIADFSVSGSSSIMMMYLTDTGKLRFGGRSRDTDNFCDVLSSSALCVTNKWYHIAGVLDFTNKKIRVYVNGTLALSKDSVAFGSNTFVKNATAQSTGKIGINIPITSTQYFKGYMNEMLLWKKALTEQEIRDNMLQAITSPSTNTNLVGYWPFSTNSNDYSASGFNGTNHGDAAISTGNGFNLGKHYRWNKEADGNWTTVADWQVSTDNSTWASASIYPGYSSCVHIGNHTVTLGQNVSCEDLHIAGTLNTNGHQLTVSNVLYNEGGSVTGSGGYAAYAYDSTYFKALHNTIAITGITASTTTNATMPQKVNRQWSVSGTFTGEKQFTFSWTATDDNNFTWGTRKPALFRGATKITAESYNVSSNPRSLTVKLTNGFESKADFSIGAEDDQTLPVELSSFLVNITNQNLARLTWVTQSETGALGYMIYRSQSDNLEDALAISSLIPATNTSSQQIYVFTDKDVSSGTWYYWLQSLDMDGGFSYYGSVTAQIGGGNTGNDPAIPLYNRISRLYPNPFNPSSTIGFELANKSDVCFKIYNTRGQMVQSFDLGSKEAGNHQLVWDASQLSSGVYIIKMISDGKVSQRKAVLSK